MWIGRIVWVVWLLAAQACGGATEPDPFDPEQLCSILHLKSQCRDGEVRIVDPVVIRGRVVANDAFGELDRMIVIEDDTAGIRLRLDCTSTALQWPFGSEVLVYGNGLTLYDYGGNVELGHVASGEGFGPLPESLISACLHRLPDPAGLPAPRSVAIADLSRRDIDTYVRIGPVHFLEGGTWCDRDPLDPGGTAFVTTVHAVEDAAGCRLAVRTSGGCLYAGRELPDGEVDLCGTVGYFRGEYSLCVVNYGVLFH